LKQQAGDLASIEERVKKNAALVATKEAFLEDNFYIKYEDPEFEGFEGRALDQLTELEEELWALYDQMDADGAVMQSINEAKAEAERLKAEEIAMALEAQKAFEKEQARLAEVEKKRIAAEVAAEKKRIQEEEAAKKRKAKKDAEAEAKRLEARMNAIDLLSPEE
jgi:hypothetical protein